MSGCVALRRPLPEAGCHLLCHWTLVPSKYRIVGQVELKARQDHSDTVGDSGAGTGIAEWLLPVPGKARPAYGQSGLVEGRRPSHQEIQRAVRGEPVGV